VPSKGFKIVVCGECMFCCKNTEDMVWKECRAHPPQVVNGNLSVYPQVRVDTWACAEGKPIAPGKPAPKRKPKAKKETADD
jgi:hypothetical protein